MRWLLKKKKQQAILLGIGRRFGESKWRTRLIYSPDRLANDHLYCIGASGSGKTRDLFNLLTQTLDVSRRSIVLFEPHGDLYANALSFIAHKVFGPDNRQDLAERLVLIEPTDLRRGSVGINLLEREVDQLPYEIVAELITAFHTIWEGAWGARLEDILRNGCLALQETGLTLVEMPRLLMDAEFRRFVISQLANEDVKMYFTLQFHGFSPTDQRTFVESTRNKISAFISNPYLKPILSQTTSTVRFSDLMNEGKIVLINLSRAKLKTESRRLFGSLLFAKLLMATLGRDSIPEPQRTPVSVYVDEVHEIFSKDLFLPILEGGRKYRVTLAGMFHQSLSQLDPDDVDIVLGNTSTQICFQVGRRDAERMSKEFWNFSGRRIKHEDRDLWGAKGKPTYYSVQEELEHAISELMRQGVRECYIKIKDGATAEPWIAVAPEVQYPPSHPEWEDALREISASRYNRSLDDIEAEVRERKERLETAMCAVNAEPTAQATSKPIRLRRKRR